MFSKNRSGITHIILIALIAALGAAGIGYYIYSHSTSSEFNYKNLTDEQKADYDQATTDAQAINAWIEGAQGAGVDSAALEEFIDQFMENGRDDIAKEANRILTKNPCDALMIDIENALKLASAAWHFGDEATGDALWEWAREAFRGFIVDAALAVGSTFMEDPEFDLFDYTHDERLEIYKKARETFYNRALLAQQAQLFGFVDYHRQILAGEYLKPVCIQLWNVSLETDFDSGDGFSTEEHWTIGANINDVAIYKDHPELDIPSFYRQQNEKGFINVREWWWKEDALQYSATVTGDLWFDIRMRYEEDKNDFWEDKIFMETHADLDRPDPIIHWSDGFSEPIWKFFDNGTMKFEVPALYVFRRQPFTIEDVQGDPKDVFGETITTRARFTPSKRVLVEDLSL